LTYEALVDSGITDFKEFASTGNVGVFAGSSFSDFHSQMLTRTSLDGREHIGAAGTMLANSISKFFKFKGPSMKQDSACSSSLQAFDTACQYIENGCCTSAIVVGSNMIFDNRITQGYDKMGILGDRCRSFTTEADGYIRKEAVVVIVLSSFESLQSGTCRAKVLGHCSLFGSGESVTSPCAATQKELYHRTSDQACTHLPNDGDGFTVDFIECHATGTKKGDEVETSVITECIESPEFKLLKRPMLIGSVKSNVGHTESASGLMGVARLLLAMEDGQCSPNLHFSRDKASPQCRGIVEDTLRVPTSTVPMKKDAIVIVNSFGFGGSDVQVMLQGCVESNACSTTTDYQEEWRNINLIKCRSVDSAKLASLEMQDEDFICCIAPFMVSDKGHNVLTFTTPGRRREATVKESSHALNQPFVIFPGNGTDWDPTIGEGLYHGSRIYKEMFD
jgi:fatty acid synthase